MDTTNEGVDGILAAEFVEAGEDDPEVGSTRDAAGRVLRTVGRIWGRDKVQHYPWAIRGGCGGTPGTIVILKHALLSRSSTSTRVKRH